MRILGKEFNAFNETICDIFINNEKMSFNKELTFKNKGINDVSYFLKSSAHKTIKNLSYMFYNCTNLYRVSLQSCFNTKNVTNMSYMFANCTNLTEAKFSELLDVGNVINMQCMFYNCSNLTIYKFMVHFNSELNASKMFKGCGKIKNFSFPISFGQHNGSEAMRDICESQNDNSDNQNNINRQGINMDCPPGPEISSTSYQQFSSSTSHFNNPPSNFTSNVVSTTSTSNFYN